MKKNIMFLIGQLRNGGAERVVSNLCTDLKEEYNITLIVRSLKDADKIYIPSVKIIEINELSWWLTLPLGIHKIHRLKKKLKIDITISFHLKYNIYNYLSKYKDKIIVSIRNYETYKQNTYTKLQKILYKKILKKVDLIVNVSKSVMIDQKKLYKTTNNIVIPNYIDLNKINKLKKEKIKNDIINKNTILTVGRLVPQKGIIHLINSMKYIVKQNKKINLVIIGRGPLKEELQNQIKKLNLESNIKILDFNNNVYKYMYNSKVFILPSIFEGMPNVLLEALATGTPVIATDCFGGTKEILQKNYTNKKTTKITYTDAGILIPNFDKNTQKNEKLLAKAILELFNNKKLYNKYKNNNRINDFTKEKILPKWEKIINK